VVDYVRQWRARTEIRPAVRQLARHRPEQVPRLEGSLRQAERTQRLGAARLVLEDWEKQAIIRFSFEYPLEGYRRLAFMMLDRDVVPSAPAACIAY